MVELQEAPILHLLKARAAENPEEIAFHCYNRGEWTWALFWKEIESTAGFLISNGIRPGDSVLMQIANSPEFLVVFFAIQRLGCVPVPLFPGTGKGRTARLARICQAQTTVSIHQQQEPGKPDFTIDRLRLLPEPHHSRAPRRNLPDLPGTDGFAMIQFTSGSTGFPSGVRIRHSSLGVNIRQMVEAMEITDRDVFVNWLPMYHDMGLILMTLVPLVLGCRLVFMPTGFRIIRRWLSLIEQFKATFIAAPDFVYRRIPALIRGSDPRDISSLRVALNAAEPVRASTIRNFEHAFGIHQVMMPAYGLAEATVGVCSRPPGAPIKLDSRGCVCVGKPFAGIGIRIRDADSTGTGEIQIRTPAATDGYCGDHEASAALFSKDGWIRTGDLGYLDDSNELFVVGRIKNAIRQEGRSMGAREVEECMDDLNFVRRSAAFGIDRGGPEGEMAVVCLETRLPAGNTASQSRAAISAVRVFQDYFGFRPGRIVLLPPGAIPLTSNGKVRYSELKRLYESRELPELRPRSPNSDA